MKNKKIISIVLSIILVISLTATIFIASANAKEVAITVTTDKQEIKAGETVTVSVSVTTNFPVATMSIPVFYDKTLVDVESCETPLDYAYASSTTDETAVDSAKIYANTGIESEKFGFVLATYIAAAGDTLAETLTDTVVLNFTVTAKADVSGSAIFKIVSESAKTEDNIKGMLYFGAQPKSNVVDEIPENVENVNLDNAQAEVIIANGVATLLPNKELTAVVDNENNYVYGIPAGTTTEELSEYFIVSNGSFKMVANASGYTNGTGATLVVMDTKGNEVATYTLVVFGDVNGDAAISDTDAAAVGNASLGGTIEGEANNMAADINGDGGITDTDSATVSNASLGGEITINPYE